MTETKKEAFRKYLESAGAIDSLTRVLVALYEEQDRPSSATEYIKVCEVAVLVRLWLSK
jgi:hypothetical protein